MAQAKVRTHRLDRLRNLRYHHKLIFSVLIVFGILVAIVALAKDREVLKITSAYGAEDPQFPAYIAALVGAEATSGNTFEILENGDAFLPAMLHAIAQARTRVDFETYVYEKGQVADEFTDALVAAQKRGAQVNLVVDALGSDKMPQEQWDRLRKAGAHAGDYGMPVWYKLQQINYRTHRKVLVVDGKVAFTGGAGVADHWIGHAQDPDHWRDMMVRVEGPIARLMEAAFDDNFVRSLGPVVPVVEPPRGTAPPNAHDSAFVIRSASTGGSNDMKRAYMLAIASARHTLDICSPYFLLDASSKWALARARERGVRIRVLVEGDHTDAKIVKYASRNAYDALMAEGISVYEYQPTMMHTKVTIVDGMWSMFGSANFDNRSLELNDEMNVAVTDRPLAQQLTSDFERDLRSARELDLDSWRRRSPLDKVRESFWSYFGEVF